MQTKTTTQRFGSGWFGASLVALGIAAAVGIGTLAQRDVELPSLFSGGERASSETVAFYSSGMGEGLVGSDFTTTRAVKAHYAPSMGEGLVGNHQTLPATIEARYAPGQGEGLVGGAGNLAILSSPLNTYSNAGMGEGGSGLAAQPLSRPRTSAKAWAGAGSASGSSSYTPTCRRGHSLGRAGASFPRLATPRLRVAP